MSRRLASGTPACDWAELSTKLESWLADWFNKDLYARRIQLAGGKAEKGNGFEVWRQLYRQYSGGTEIVNYGGQMRLKDWPKCTNVQNLEAHMDSWKSCLEEYGSELYAAPSMLRTMLIGILPAEIENEIMDKPELEREDYVGIFQWVKKRIEYKRQKALADFARKSGGGLVAAVTSAGQAASDSGSDIQYPVHVDPFTDAGKSKTSPGTSATVAPPPPSLEGMPTRQEMRELINALKRQPSRARSPSPRNPRNPRTDGAKVKFAWNADDCWHCAGKHKREDCQAWQKLMKAHNGTTPRAQWKSPPGYVSAKAKAYAAWKEKHGKPAKINMLANGDVELDSEDESDADSDEGMTIRAVMRPHTREAINAFTGSQEPAPTQISNSFEALKAFDDDETSPDIAQRLEGWAHKVTSKAEKARPQSEKKSVTSQPYKS